MTRMEGPKKETPENKENGQGRNCLAWNNQINTAKNSTKKRQSQQIMREKKKKTYISCRRSINPEIWLHTETFSNCNKLVFVFKDADRVWKNFISVCVWKKKSLVFDIKTRQKRGNVHAGV